MNVSCTHDARPASIVRSNRRFCASSRNLRASSPVGLAVAVLAGAFFAAAATAGTAEQTSRGPMPARDAANETNGFFIDFSAREDWNRGEYSGASRPRIAVLNSRSKGVDLRLADAGRAPLPPQRRP